MTMSFLWAASSTAILLHAFLLLLLAAMVAAASEHGGGDVNMTTSFTNAAASVDQTEIYYCFLCTGRHPILIHKCPIYWDTCFLDCWDWDAIDDPGNASSSAPPSSVQYGDCYVMKKYMSGRYVIVQRMSCDTIGPCYLTCGGGELVDQKLVTTAPATIQAGMFVPNSDEELCGTQAAVNALRTPPSPASAGVVVPGAH